MRFTLGLCFAAGLAIAGPAGAALKHYRVESTVIWEFNTANPSPNRYPPAEAGGAPAQGKALIDDTGSNGPILRRLLLVSESAGTFNIYPLSGFIFLSLLYEQGPKEAVSFTGTGDTSTAIAWGLVTGWTITGGLWCNASPTFICTYAGGQNLGTVEPHFYSPFYDLGTWTFHGTGFTSVPFVHQRGDPAGAIGNVQYQLRGRLSAGLVPAVPVLGVALLGASLLLAGARLSRKH